MSIISNFFIMGYSTTYAGIIVMILGWLHLADYVTQTDVATVIDNIIQAAGILIAAYGRWKAGGVNPLGFRKKA